MGYGKRRKFIQENNLQTGESQPTLETKSELHQTKGKLPYIKLAPWFLTGSEQESK